MNFFKRKQVPASKPDIRYANPSHEAFNRMLEEKRNPTPASIDWSAPWMKAETLANLPQLRRDFDMNRDPYVRFQLQDLEQDNIDQTGGSARAKSKGQPKPELKPKGDLRRRADKAVSESKWLDEQRRSAMEFAPSDQKIQEITASYNRMGPAPER